MTKKKETRGGKRIGAGRPKSAPTLVLSFRVPKEKAKTLKQQILKLIKACNLDLTNNS
jgi:hypothetical protein